MFLRAILIPKVHVAIENLALRQQLAVYRQSAKRPNLRPRDRVFWVGVSRFGRTFLDNHVQDIAACDFFTLSTATFRVLYVFIVLRHDRRHIAHFNVTATPNAKWTAQQVAWAAFLAFNRDFGGPVWMIHGAVIGGSLSIVALVVSALQGKGQVES